ncbi:hypothetical protein PGTUg99_028641 [Puccinia graminis f. sp. tritici]|uniref:Uncharacterized protein n=1 Tax=Puccinia graminis f. sp. tritici TaxID=56615 RepID=A0A5B0R9X6_PUCGR|nr:hypothetical protein PGTUg99_028641 [Puccinia graminis f. sp. tritici]
MPNKRRSAPISRATPASTPTTTPSNPPKKKKAPVAWEKDGEGGNSSIIILLDWLATEGNYQRWRGDTKNGSTKAALANEILADMAEVGITHRDNKGIQTKIQELQQAYSKASYFLRNTGAGLTEEDIENGTSTLQAALFKICKYWDELHPIMANPPVTCDTLNPTVPNLIDPGVSNDPEQRLTPAADTPAADTGVNSVPDGSGAESEEDSTIRTKKKKGSSKDSLGLEKIIADSNTHRRACLEARKERDRLKLSAKHKEIKLAAQEKRAMLQIELRKTRILKIEAQSKVRQNEMAEVRERIRFTRELRDLGESPEDIAQYLAQQFAVAQGASGLLPQEDPQIIDVDDDIEAGNPTQEDENQLVDHE